MFQTFILMCVIGTTECTHYEDSFGPYHTEEQCIARAVEGSKQLAQIHGDERPLEFSYKCEVVSEGV